MVRSILFPAMLICAGCASYNPELVLPMSETMRVSVVSEPHANNDMTIAVDVVLMHGDANGCALAEMSADEWFMGREELIDESDGAIVVQSWQVSSGEKLDHELMYGLSADRLFVFCRYMTRGKHQVSMPMTQALAIRLREKDFVAYADSSLARRAVTELLEPR
jgi:hypothetical protein